MKRCMLLLGAVIVLSSGGAMASKDAKAAKHVKKADGQIACAVMVTNKVDIKKATHDKMFADYKGHRYFFCCEGCPDAFKKEPAKYAKNASIPVPGAPKKKK